MRVYLVGVMSEDPKTWEWRKEAARLLRNDFEVDDPTRFKFDLEVMKKANGNSGKLHKLVAEHQSEILLPKSLLSVQSADIILANLSLEPNDRPLIGSIMEIAWAYLLHKTVIAIKGDSYYSKHPMILGSVHAWASNVEEGCKIIKEFFTLGSINEADSLYIL